MTLTYLRTSDVEHGTRAAELYHAARSARRRAYAPYSKFMVGSAILAADRQVYVGCNVEGADYDVTHGEEGALMSMVLADQRTPLLIANAGGLEGAEAYAVMSCGKCRQKLMEFSSLSACEVYCVVSTPEELRSEWGSFRLVSLEQLLPGAFGPADVGIELAKYRR